MKYSTFWMRSRTDGRSIQTIALLLFIFSHRENNQWKFGFFLINYSNECLKFVNDFRRRSHSKRNILKIYTPTTLTQYKWNNIVYEYVADVSIDFSLMRNECMLQMCQLQCSYTTISYFTSSTKFRSIAVTAEPADLAISSIKAFLDICAAVLVNRIVSYMQCYFAMSIYIFFNVYINTKLTNTRIHNKTRKHTIL